MPFTPSIPQKLTVDLDDGRINSHPSLIKDKNGRLIVFYSKTLPSGRISTSRVTFTPSSFDIHVEAGNGEITDTPIIWSATDLIATPETYSIVYVDISGTVKISSDIQKNIYQDAIILAFLNVGLTSIVNLEEVERVGTYLFTQRQVWNSESEEWEWDNYEYRINNGQEPFALYDSSSDKIYLSYKRDGESFNRLFNLTDPLTWSYLHHYTITAGVIYPDFVQSRTYSQSVGAGPSGSFKSDIELFNMESPPHIGYKYIAGSYIPYVNIPWLASGAYTPYLSGNPELEVYTFDGENYNLEGTFPMDIGSRAYPEWQEWGLPTGTVYLGVHVTFDKNSIYQGGDYRTPPEKYEELYISESRDYTYDTSDPQINSVDKSSISSIVGCGGGKSDVLKTSESSQSYKISDEEDASSIGAGGSLNYFTKTGEWGQSFETVDGSGEKADCIGPGGGLAYYTKTNEIPI